MLCCLCRRTHYLRYRPSRQTYIRARRCSVLELQCCYCCSSAFITPGTASLTTYLSTFRKRILSGAKTKKSLREGLYVAPAQRRVRPDLPKLLISQLP